MVVCASMKRTVLFLLMIVSVFCLERGGVPVLNVTPMGYEADHRILMYVHGGAYTYGAADSTVLSAGLMADGARMQVVSVLHDLRCYNPGSEVCSSKISVFHERPSCEINPAKEGDGLFLSLNLFELLMTVGLNSIL